MREIAVVTGASSGIGKAFAKKLAALGYDLIAIANDQEGLRRVSAEITATCAVAVDTVCADLSSERTVEAIAEGLRQKTIAMLVNNAGIGIGSRFHVADEALVHTALSLHVLAPVRFARAVLPGMMERNTGTIINVSSAAAFARNRKSCVVYNSTKVFLVTFSECLQAEMDACGRRVKIQALCPGFTRTDFHHVARPGGRDFSAIPPFMWMTPGEVADKSLGALKSRYVIFVPGALNKVIVAMLRHRMAAWIPNFVMGYGS